MKPRRKMHLQLPGVDGAGAIGVEEIECLPVVMEGLVVSTSHRGRWSAATDPYTSASGFAATPLHAFPAHT